MERRYSETTLKKKRLQMKLLAGGLTLGILSQVFSGTPRGFWRSIGVSGTNCMQPVVVKYLDFQKEKGSAPLLIQLLAPKIFSYTWQEEVPAFAIIEVEKQDDFSEKETVQLVVSREDALSLLQENLYVEGSNRVFEPAEPDVSIEEITSVLETEDPMTVPFYDIEKYSDATQLVKDFYVIDASTSADAGLLDIHTLTSYNCAIDKNSEGPQILVYHSHSQEAFVDSVPEDESTTIVGAGKKLCRLLQEEYGYKVLHHTGIYDLPSRDNAYSNALPDIERVLAENPTIQVVIDLHRDAVAEGTKLVTTIDGKDYARFMFFNGICRSTNGPITYLSNPYLQENLAFSFQSQVIAERFFPGITRKIYLKAWRYNMHLKPRNMLIELGAQTNTVEEIMNTTEILAFVINKVLSGQ